MLKFARSRKLYDYRNIGILGYIILCIFLLLTMLHGFSLKMFVKIFCANCVPLGLLDTSFLVFLHMCAHIPMYLTRSSRIDRNM
jgi:hypothetical protein